MQKKIEDHYRKEIIAGLNILPKKNRDFFIRIHSHKIRDISIEDLVSKMPVEKLDNALRLVEATLAKQES